MLSKFLLSELMHGIAHICPSCCTWLAVRGGSTSHLAAAFGLGVLNCSFLWTQGNASETKVHTAHDDNTGHGWVRVAGYGDWQRLRLGGPSDAKVKSSNINRPKTRLPFLIQTSPYLVESTQRINQNCSVLRIDKRNCGTSISFRNDPFSWSW